MRSFVSQASSNQRSEVDDIAIDALDCTLQADRLIFGVVDEVVETTFGTHVQRLDHPRTIS